MLNRHQARALILLITYAFLNFAFINCSQVSSNSASENASLEEKSHCPQAPTHLRNPTTIDQVTDLINALPKPLSVSCFVENLPTPLKVFAVNSSFSAQPSDGADSPRIFIINGNLVLSVVPAGVGKDHIEYGQFINSSETVKAELAFPVIDEVSKSQPYDQAKFGAGTNCRVCHGQERPVTGFGGDAFASAVLRPDPFARQSASRMRNLAVNCDKDADSFRCQILNSVFVKGRAQDAELP